MKFALDIATILFLATGAIGVLLLGRLLWGIFFRPHALPSNPLPAELPSPAIDAVQAALDRMRRRFYAASGEAKTRLGYEVRRLEHRLTQVSDNVGELQQPYRHVGMKRLDLWKQWRDLLNTLEHAHSHHQRVETRAALTSAEEMYKQLTRDLEAERQRYVARNKLIVAELQQQGVLSLPEELPGEGAPAHPPAEDPAAAQGAPPAHAAEAPLAQGHPAEGQPSGAPSATAEAMDTEPPDALPTAPEGPPADMSPLHQAQLFDPAVAKQGRRYGDAAFSLEGVRGGVASGLDLSGISFTHVTFAGLHRYRECRFTHANLRGISLTRQERPHQFFRCGFGGTDWRDARLEYTVFNQCDLSNTRWEGATLELVRFHHCELDGVDWGGISLQRSIMSDDMLADVDFSTAAAPPRNFTSAAPEQAGDGPAGDGPAGEVSAEQAPAGEMADKHAPAAGAAADAPASTAQTDPAPGAAAAGQPVKPETPLTPRQANRRSKQPARPATAPTPPEEPGT